MNTSRKSHLSLLSSGLVTTLLLLFAATPVEWTIFPEAKAQNDTSVVNQTAGGVSAQNQTATGLGNITAEDLDEVTDNLATARESLQANETQSAYVALSTGDSNLFIISNGEGAQAKAVAQAFQPLRDLIQKAQDALEGQDNNASLQQLNSAEVELLRLKNMLPAEEGTEEEG
jgi:hypothetical protein